MNKAEQHDDKKNHELSRKDIVDLTKAFGFKQHVFYESFNAFIKGKDDKNEYQDQEANVKRHGKIFGIVPDRFDESYIQKSLDKLQRRKKSKE